jgi:hypothetical protein
MMENENLKGIIETTYRRVNFVSRYKETMVKHNDFENRMRKVEKKEILNILKDLGYFFKVFSPGRDFYIENEVSNFRFVFSFNCKDGIMTNCIFNYQNGKKITFEENLGFVYRYLLDDMELPINAQKFKNYTEFKEIISSLLRIYEDFQVEFLKQVNDQEAV